MESGPREFPFNWGHLPELNSNHTQNKKKCEGIIYSKIPFSPGENFGEELFDVDEIASGVGHQMYLGDTCIIAEVSTTVYESEENKKFNHYSVSIKIPNQNLSCLENPDRDICKIVPSSFRVWYDQKIAEKDVGNAFKGKPMDKIVTYNKKRRRVFFLVGKRKYETLLPAL